MLAEVTPLFKKANPFDKINYRPVSLLLHMSKAQFRHLQWLQNVNYFCIKVPS